MILLFAGLIAGGCDEVSDGFEGREGQAEPGTIQTVPNSTTVKVMTWNVQNLFDTQHDSDREDWTYLPASEKTSAAFKARCRDLGNVRYRRECLELDWNDDVLAAKLAALSQVLDAEMPDVVLLQEVENQAVVNQLNQALNKPFDHVVLLEGYDRRGIDQAVLSRLAPAAKPQLHDLYAEGRRLARGALGVPLRLPGGEVLRIYNVHLPAPYHPLPKRTDAITSLGHLLADVPAMSLVGGDFNVPVSDGILWDRLGPDFTLAHRIGCQQCTGTNYYGGNRSWSFLDTFALGSALTDGQGWEVNAQSIGVISSHPEQLTGKDRPKRFYADSRQGVSDHLPMVLTLHFLQ